MREKALFLLLVLYCSMVRAYGQYETPKVIDRIDHWVKYNDNWISLEPRWFLNLHHPGNILDTVNTFSSSFSVLDGAGKFSMYSKKTWQSLTEYEKRHHTLRDYHYYSTSFVKIKTDSLYSEYYVTGAFRNHKHYKKDTDAFVAKIGWKKGEGYEVIWFNTISKKQEDEINTYEYGMNVRSIGGNCIISVYRPDFKAKDLVVAFDDNGEQLWEIEAYDFNKGFWDFLPFDNKGTKFLSLAKDLDRYDNGNFKVSLAVIETATGKIINKRKLCSPGYAGCMWKNENCFYVAVNFKQFLCEELNTTFKSSAQSNVVVFKLADDLSIKDVYTYMSEEPFMVNDAKIYSDGVLMSGISGARLDALAYYHPSDPNLPNAKTFGLVINASGDILDVTSKYLMTVKKFQPSN